MLCLFDVCFFVCALVLFVGWLVAWLVGCLFDCLLVFVRWLVRSAVGLLVARLLLAVVCWLVRPLLDWFAPGFVRLLICVCAFAFVCLFACGWGVWCLRPRVGGVVGWVVG